MLTAKNRAQLWDTLTWVSQNTPDAINVGMGDILELDGITADDYITIRQQTHSLVPGLLVYIVRPSTRTQFAAWIAMDAFLAAHKD